MKDQCHQLARFLSYLTFRRVRVTGTEFPEGPTLYLFRHRQGWSENWLVYSRLPSDTRVLANESVLTCWLSHQALDENSGKSVSYPETAKRFWSNEKRLLLLVDDIEGQGRPFLSTAELLQYSLAEDPSIKQSLKIVPVTCLSRHQNPIGSELEISFGEAVSAETLIHGTTGLEQVEQRIDHLMSEHEPPTESLDLFWNSGLMNQIRIQEQMSLHQCLKSITNGLPAHVLGEWLDRKDHRQQSSRQQQLQLCYQLLLLPLNLWLAASTMLLFHLPQLLLQKLPAAAVSRVAPDFFLIWIAVVSSLIWQLHPLAAIGVWLSGLIGLKYWAFTMALFKALMKSSHAHPFSRIQSVLRGL